VTHLKTQAGSKKKIFKNNFIAMLSFIMHQ